MFGHDDTTQQSPQSSQAEPQADASLSASAPSAPPVPASAVDASEVDEALKALTASAEEDVPAPSVAAPAPAPAEPAVVAEPEAEAPAQSAPIVTGVPEVAEVTETEPEVTEATEEAAETEDTTSRGSAPAVSEADTSALLDLKQAALQQLSPLVDQLDQTPEEHFRTIMMMIQASDDQSMLQSAYDTAQQITDEKAKAQALLDVVNEINYFTQQPAAEA